MKMPRHLEPWARELDLFSDDMAVGLGDLVLRLSALVGDVDIRSAEHGDFDGYDGISRRGALHRLLVSEWALLDEVPDEFMRRVINAEQSYLAPARVTPTSEQHCAVLLDIGGDVLGGPRVVQLALMIVLAARAARHRMCVTWAIPGVNGVFDQLSAETIKRWLNARRHQSISLDELAAWRALPQICTANERWLLGGAGLTAHTNASEACITLSDSPNPTFANVVGVEVRPLRSRVRTVNVTLPDAKLAARLLRDPCKAAQTPLTAQGAVFNRHTNLIVTRDGRRIFARGAGETLVVVPCPNSPRAQPGTAKTIRSPGGRIFAVGLSGAGNRILLGCVEDDELCVHRMSKAGNSVATTLRVAMPCEFQHSGPMLAMLVEIGEHHFAFSDGAGNVYRLKKGSIELVVSHVAATAVARMQLQYIVDNNGAATLGSVADRPREAHELCMLGAPLTTAFISTAGICAIDRGPFWSLAVIGSDDVITRPNVPNVVGVLPSRQEHPAQLVALDEQRRAVLLLSGTDTLVIARTTAPIKTTTVGAGSQLIAWLTDGNQLTVYSTTQATIVLNISVHMADV